MSPGLMTGSPAKLQAVLAGLGGLAGWWQARSSTGYRAWQASPSGDNISYHEAVLMPHHMRWCWPPTRDPATRSTLLRAGPAPILLLGVKQSQKYKQEDQKFAHPSGLPG